MRPEFIDELCLVQSRDCHKSVISPSASDSPTLIQDEETPSAHRTDVLVVELTFEGSKTKIESKLVEDSFQIVNVHLRRVVSPAAPAESSRACLPSIPVKRDTQRKRALHDVKQFSEWQIEEKPDNT